ncbi:MAG: glycosyltransferase family 9 protein [Acidobacteriota bacterium]
MSGLQIYEPRERAAVRLADLLIAPLRFAPRRPRRDRDERVLLLRLERIGDLLMTLEAIRDARRAWPDAQIDLAVGTWNEPLARLIGDVTSVVVADGPWLARGDRSATWPRLVAAARGWRNRRYDVVVNIEPDIRSNWLAWMTGAPVRVGYRTGGGGAFLTDATDYDPSRHVSENAREIVARAAGRAVPVAETDRPRLIVPADAVARAKTILEGADGPVVGIHAAGGRQSKQWHLDRFAEVGRTLIDSRGATIVLTGGSNDADQVEEVARRIGRPGVVRADDALDLPTTAALLTSLDLFISSDTGPMHLAAAVGTPVVALFGPSEPKRYGPRAVTEHILRVDLPCSPCGQVRLPPVRCRGHVPDCMDGITAAAVIARALDVIDAHLHIVRPEPA